MCYNSYIVIFQSIAVHLTADTSLLPLADSNQMWYSGPVDTDLLKALYWWALF